MSYKELKIIYDEKDGNYYFDNPGYDLLGPFSSRNEAIKKGSEHYGFDEKIQLHLQNNKCYK
jgi:hypothetical protein